MLKENGIKTDLWADNKKAGINNISMSVHLKCKYHLCSWLTDCSICIFVQKARQHYTEKTTNTQCKKIVNIIRNLALGKRNFCKIKI